MADSARVAECPRHRFPVVPTGDPARPYWVVRCVHRGARFVVQIQSEASAFCAVDYVEDRADGGMVIETHNPLDGPGAIAVTFDALVVRMQGGDPPRPEP